MSKSWGHRVYRMPEEEAQKFARLGWTCASGRCCKARAEFWCEYRYVTGRAGRTSFAQKKACLEHAQRFAKNHKVEVEGVQHRPRHASEIAVEQIAPKKEES